jgi:GNAT superfamily N-acetyltransferase
VATSRRLSAEDGEVIVWPERGAEVRLATSRDLVGVSEINRFWLAAGRSGHRGDGYLFGEPYADEVLARIAADDGVSVAEARGRVVGYYLFDDHSCNSTTARYLDVIGELTRRGAIDPRWRVCRRAQVAIRPEWQSSGLSVHLLRVLRDRHRDRFDAVFSVVAKDNPKLGVHLRVGWRIVGGDRAVHYVLLPLRG